MLYYIGRRLAELVPVLLLMSVIIFGTMHLLPGDPATLMLAGAEGGSVSPERLAELRKAMGLNDPLYVQYARFIGGVVQGDLGTSIRFRLPVTELVLDRLPYTVTLSLVGMGFAMLIGLTLGTVAAIWRNTWVDTLCMSLSFVGVSMPVFWLGLLLIFLFSMQLGWLPSSGAEGWQSVLLPGFTLGFVSSGLVSRLTRSSLLDVMQEDFIRTARAKGLSDGAVLFTHAFRNALIPIVTMLGLQFGGMLAGSVITETVFSRPGVGQLVVSAILWKDYPLVQGTVLVLSVMYVIVNLAVDVAYAWIDPRIHYS